MRETFSPPLWQYPISIFSIRINIRSAIGPSIIWYTFKQEAYRPRISCLFIRFKENKVAVLIIKNCFPWMLSYLGRESLTLTLLGSYLPMETHMVNKAVQINHSLSINCLISLKFKFTGWLCFMMNS